MNGAYLVDLSSKYLEGSVLREGWTAVVGEGLIRRNLGQVAMKFIKNYLWSSNYRKPTNLMQ